MIKGLVNGLTGKKTLEDYINCQIKLDNSSLHM